MLSKIIVISTMFVILLCLFSGLIFLVRDEGKTQRTVKALSWRIGISIILFIFLIVGFSLGWITPHSLS